VDDGGGGGPVVGVGGAFLTVWCWGMGIRYAPVNSASAISGRKTPTKADGDVAGPGFGEAGALCRGLNVTAGCR